MEFVIFLLLKITRKTHFKAQDVLAELGICSHPKGSIYGHLWVPSPFQREHQLPSSLLFPKKVGILILAMGCTMNFSNFSLGARNGKDPCGDPSALQREKGKCRECSQLPPQTGKSWDFICCSKRNLSPCNIDHFLSRDRLHLHEMWGKEEKQRFPHFLQGAD